MAGHSGGSGTSTASSRLTTFTRQGPWLGPAVSTSTGTKSKLRGIDITVMSRSIKLEIVFHDRHNSTLVAIIMESNLFLLFIFVLTIPIRFNLRENGEYYNASKFI